MLLLSIYIRHLYKTLQSCSIHPTLVLHRHLLLLSTVIDIWWWFVTTISYHFRRRGFKNSRIEMVESGRNFVKTTENSFQNPKMSHIPCWCSDFPQWLQMVGDSCNWYFTMMFHELSGVWGISGWLKENYRSLTSPLPPLFKSESCITVLVLWYPVHKDICEVLPGPLALHICNSHPHREFVPPPPKKEIINKR